MPTASDEQRNTMNEWFGDPISDSGPLDFLFARGFTDDRGLIQPPTSGHRVSCYELECAYFLCDEWDYGYKSNGAKVICLCGKHPE